MMCTMPISVPVRLWTSGSGSSDEPEAAPSAVDEAVPLQQHQPGVGAHQERGPERQQHDDQDHRSPMRGGSATSE